MNDQRCDEDCIRRAYEQRDAWRAEAKKLRARLKWFEERAHELGQAVDDAMGAGEGPVCWAALERIESVAYLLRTGQDPKPHDPDELDKHLGLKWIDRPRNAEMFHEAVTERAAKLDFKYDDLSAFKPSPEFDTALKKVMDQFLAWRCPKCGAPGRFYWRHPQLDPFFLETANTLKGPSIGCSAGCVLDKGG